MTYKPRCEGCPRIEPYKQDSMERIGRLVRFLITEDQLAELQSTYESKGLPMPSSAVARQEAHTRITENVAESEMAKRELNNRAIDRLQQFCVLGALPSADSAREVHPVCTSLAAPFYRGPKHD